jgi:HNH endonuclease
MSRTPVPAALANEVVARWGSACVCCGTATLARHDGSDASLEVDHVVPEAWGGPTVALNLQPLCRRCNQAKADTHSIDHRPWGDDEESREVVQSFATDRPRGLITCGPPPMLLTGDRCLCDAFARVRDWERTGAVI